MITQGLIGALAAVIFLLVLQSSLVRAARKRSTEKDKFIKFMDLLVTADDNHYSLSRFQLYLWTVFVVIGFTAVSIATMSLPEIPQNLYLLLGVNVTAAVASTGITDWKRDKPPVPATRSDFVQDIFFESKASLDLPRTQMFIWTIISLIGFIVLVIKTFVDGYPAIPNVPVGLVALMGISHGAYLGVKAAKKPEE